MPTDPVDQLRALGDRFDELVPPVTMKDLRGRPKGAGGGRAAARVFAVAAAVVTLVAVGAIVLSRSDNDDDRRPMDTRPFTDNLVVHHDLSGIVVAADGAGSLPGELLDGYTVLDTAAAYSLPDGEFAYLTDDGQIAVRNVDGTTRVVVTAAEGTHLRLFDAGTALGRPVIVYATVGEDETERVTLHVVGADGSDDTEYGEIGFWEGTVSYARLGGDTVRTEEFTVTLGFARSLDLATGEWQQLTQDTPHLTYPSVSRDGSTTADVLDETVTVTAPDRHTTVAFDLGGDTVCSLEPSNDRVIINGCGGTIVIASDIWSSRPTTTTVPFKGIASFAEQADEPLADPIVQAAALWARVGPADYQFIVSVFSPFGSITVECEFAVRGGVSFVVHGPTRAELGQQPQLMDGNPNCLGMPQTVEEALRLIAEHRADGHDVPVDLDVRGVPLQFTLDADQAESDGSSRYTLRIEATHVLPTVTLADGEHLVCGPAGGNGVSVSLSSDLIGLTARIVIDNMVLASSEPTSTAGTVRLVFDASTVPSDAPNPSGKIGELQILDADGYVLAIQPFTWARVPSDPCY